MRTFLLLLFILSISCSHGQTLEFEQNPINVEKWNDTQLVIPIEIEVSAKGVGDINQTLSLSKNNAKASENLRLPDSVWRKVEIRSNDQSVVLKSGKKKTKTFYVVIDKSLNLTSNKVFYLTATMGSISKDLEIQMNRANDLSYTLTDYLENDDLSLDRVTKVESNNNLLTISGEIDDSFQKRIVALRKGEVYAVWDKKYITSFKKLNFLDAFSIFSVPFKVRPKITTQIKNRDTSFLRTATSGLSNVGLNLEIAKVQVERYFSSGKKSAHKFNAGLFAAPGVEELDSISTKGYVKRDVKSKQLFVSAGLTLSYSYNDISFVFVPFGWDLKTSAIGKEWIYSGKRWWGFGIGVSPKIFSAIVNK